MSAKFFDLMKYAATGIASPSMTAFDKMLALSMGGAKVQSITGVPPISFKGNGTPLISWSMLGNTVQNGTPTPDDPITPQGTGDRTANLFDEAYPNLDTTIKYIPILVGDGTFTLSTDIGGSLNRDCCLFLLAGSVDSGANYNANGVIFGTNRTVTSSGGYVTIGYRIWGTGNPSTAHTMLNLGSTALPYEPYGEKITLTNAGQTVPVYLGQTQTVRRIKKLVLDGTENWAQNPSATKDNTIYVYISQTINYGVDEALCSHFAHNSRAFAEDVESFHFATPPQTLRFRVSKTLANDVDDFKYYLAAQYAAGTPVTVWYALATPETAIVNEPLMKIGDYADELRSTEAGVAIPTVAGANTLTVGTTVQPSSMSITGKIKPVT